MISKFIEAFEAAEHTDYAFEVGDVSPLCFDDLSEGTVLVVGLLQASLVFIAEFAAPALGTVGRSGVEPVADRFVFEPEIPVLPVPGTENETADPYVQNIGEP